MNELFVTQKVRVSELVPHEKNPRKIRAAEKQKLWARIEKYGLIGIPGFIESIFCWHIPLVFNYK